MCAAPVAHTCVRVGVWVCVRRSDLGRLAEVGRHEWRQVGAETMADSVCEDLVVGLTVSQIWCFSGFMPSTGSAILLLIVELLILELGNKVAIYVIEVPDPLGTRSVPVRLYSYGDRTSIESRSK